MTVAQCTFETNDIRCLQVATWVLTAACVHEHVGSEEVCTLHGTVVLQGLADRSWRCTKCEEAPGEHSHECPLVLVSFVPIAPADAEIDPASPPVLIGTADPW